MIQQLAAKILGALVAALAIYLLGQYQGREAIQQRWDAAVSEQQIAAGEYIVKSYQNRATREATLQKTLEARERHVSTLKKEVRTYAETPVEKCRLPVEYVRLHDRISRMFNAGADGVPAADDPTGHDDEFREAALTDVEGISAYQNAVAELGACWDTLDALRGFERSNYAIANEGAGRADHAR